MYGNYLLISDAMMYGDFTRYGDVRLLLNEADDRFVIFGRGEEVTLKFNAHGLPHLPRGWKRDFLFYSNGYCKDMDPNRFKALNDIYGPEAFDY